MVDCKPGWKLHEYWDQVIFFSLLSLVCHLYIVASITQEVFQKQALGIHCPLRNVINYYCFTKQISISDHLFSWVTDELTGKMKHLSLITSQNYSFLSRYFISYPFSNCLFLWYNMQLCLLPFTLLTSYYCFQAKKKIRWL